MGQPSLTQRVTGAGVARRAPHRPTREVIGGSIQFGTKAETLARLRERIGSATIPESLLITVPAWQSEPEAVLTQIDEMFAAAPLAVRSSAFGEDGAAHSAPGVQVSELNVDGGSRQALSDAIERVIASYAGDPRDQVLLQPMLRDIVVSGVATTHEFDTGAPYYVLNYDDEPGKAVMVFRRFQAGMGGSPHPARIPAMMRELESVCDGAPLEVEFAIARNGELFLLQVRRIGVARQSRSSAEQRTAQRLEQVKTYLAERAAPRPGIAGSRTILAAMADGNPAESIGMTPRALATSLYRHLVTKSVWTEARARLGYRGIDAEELMAVIGGHPYVDIRNSFNSLLPAALPDALANRLVDAWLDRLEQHPELHDKVEFEIAQSCLDFTFETDLATRYPGLLSADAASELRTHLGALTRCCLDIDGSGSLSRALVTVDALAERQRARALTATWLQTGDAQAQHLYAAATLLDECRQDGALPFAVIARHAFIAEALLTSAIRRGAITSERHGLWKRSLKTAGSRLMNDFAAVCRGAMARPLFNASYGHLRPGGYDIVSLRYDERDDLFDDREVPEAAAEAAPFALTAQERRGITTLLGEAGFEDVDADHLLDYARRAVAGREHAEFVFRRGLSDALATIAAWGRGLDLSREDLSHIAIDDLLNSLIDPPLSDPDLHFVALADAGRARHAAARALKLSYLIRDSRDIYVVPLHRSAPAFIGTVAVEAPVTALTPRTPASISLRGQIVAIENADPGFDWIFTKGIAGLLTKFGGSNSHMAIRCAEFAIPAAIGCGEQTFQNLVNAGRAQLNCADSVLRQAVKPAIGQESGHR